MGHKNLILLIISVTGILLICEAGLRVTGTRPGWIDQFDGFKEVDSLVIYKNFETDDAGIYKFSPWVTDSLLKYFDCQRRVITNARVKQSLYESDKIYYLYESFCKQTVNPDPSLYWWILERQSEESDSNAILNTHRRILNNTAPTDRCWRAAVEQYFSRPFNHEGFRSIPFRNDSSHTLKVLVIGDSFVYGMDARPFQNSFVDLLLSRGYLVYAAGIPGTDPPQYAAIARKYIPIIKPDIVICCFYTGNDFMKSEREPSVDRPIEYVTNAGLYSSYRADGTYMTSQQAYQYYLSICRFPAAGSNKFDWFCSYTAIGSKVWNICLNKGLIRYAPRDEYYRTNKIPSDSIYRYTRKYIERIRACCEENKVPIVFTIIPEKNPVDISDTVFDYIFDHKFEMPKGLDDKKDYFHRGIHFNNDGSLKYADFLDKILKAYAHQRDSLMKNGL